MTFLDLVQDATCHMRKTLPYAALRKVSNLYNIDIDIDYLHILCEGHII